MWFLKYSYTEMYYLLLNFNQYAKRASPNQPNNQQTTRIKNKDLIPMLCVYISPKINQVQ